MTLALKWIKRIFIAIVGFTVLAIGVAMILLPGPAFIVIPAGLGILALEFAWAKRWLTTVKTHGAGIFQHMRNRARKPGVGSQPPGA